MSTTKQDAKARREEEKARARQIIAARQQEREDERQAQAKLEAIAREEAAEREEEAQREAAERIKAISRKAGSDAASYDEAVKKFEDWVKAGSEIVQLLNRRYEALPLDSAESEALVDRFGVKGAKLPTEVLPPDVEPRVVVAMREIQGWSFTSRRSVLPHTEQDQHRLRTRRSYLEVANTPGYEIIAKVGLKPFPDLNERQREIVAERQREHDQARENMKAIAPLARETTAALDMVSGSRFR